MREPVNCALTAKDVEGLRARLNRIRTLSRGDLRITEHCRQISIALDKGQRKVLRIESRINKLKPHAIMENQTKKPETLKGWLQARLKKMAEEDKSFAEKMENPKKSLDECIKFIQGEVFREYVKENKGGERVSCAMPSREEIFGLAVHYYDEQEVKIQQLPNGVAAKVQGGATLSEEELEKLKEKAKAKALEEVQAAEKKKLEEREKARRKAEAEKKKAEAEKKRAEREATGELSLFDLMSL